jgi:hypothetical protein
LQASIYSPSAENLSEILSPLAGNKKGAATVWIDRAVEPAQHQESLRGTNMYLLIRLICLEYIIGLAALVIVLSTPHPSRGQRAPIAPLLGSDIGGLQSNIQATQQMLLLAGSPAGLSSFNGGFGGGFNGFGGGFGSGFNGFGGGFNGGFGGGFDGGFNGFGVGGFGDGVGGFGGGLGGLGGGGFGGFAGKGLGGFSGHNGL